jgi:hypothetical protein
VTKLGTLAALAGTGVLAAAAFVRPPTSPVPQAFAKPATVKVATPTPLTAKTTSAPGFTVTPGVSAKGFVVEELAFAGWGNGLGELGRNLPREANPEAPMSLSVDAADRVHVLDQVNERIAIFENVSGHGVWKTIPIGSDTVQDLVVDPRGGYALLDRLKARHVRFLDASGAERGIVQLEGPGVPEGGLVTGLFAHKDGFWVDVEHEKLVRVALADGSPDPVRPTLEGRRSFNGGPLLRAARDPQGYAVVSATGAGGFFARVPFTAPVLELVGLESDGATTYIAAHVGREQQTAPFALYDEKLFVVALDTSGLEIGRFELPPNTGPEETLKTITLSPKGEVHFLHVGQTGASIRRAR